MAWLSELFLGGGIAHSVLILALVIAAGIFLGKMKVAGISLGITWILFVGIACSHFGMRVDSGVLHFMKEFGLILFVYSVGLQVGPGFFSSFKKGGLRLNMLATLIVLFGVITTYILHVATGIPITTMVGILSGAVTNTPGLGAAQEAYMNVTGIEDETIPLGYAVAYPVGVIGAILSLIALRYLLRIHVYRERVEAERCFGRPQELSVCTLSLIVLNEAIEGRRIREIAPLLNRRFVISRIRHQGDKHDIKLVESETVLRLNDHILLVTSPTDAEAIAAFFGREVSTDWEEASLNLIVQRIVLTRPELQGRTLAQLNLRQNLTVSITRIQRAGVNIVAAPHIPLQMGDRLTVVGTKQAIANAEKELGNSLKHLDNPNLLPIFTGIAVGCLVGCIPWAIPGLPQSVKLGLAGGPLIISILQSRFGPSYGIVTYTTASANLMLREIGISVFLACVGLEAGKSFVPTLLQGDGLLWMACGAAITIIPLLLSGLIGRMIFRLNYYTLMGVLSGANTNPPALAYSSGQVSCDAPAVGYATVYPLAMFLRILLAQLWILLAC